MSGIFKRWIVTAFNSEGGAYRFMAEDELSAMKQRDIFVAMGLTSVSVRSVLWDTRTNAIV